MRASPFRKSGVESRKTRAIALFGCAVLVAASAHSAGAEEVYAVKRLGDLKITEGKLPLKGNYQWHWEWQWNAIEPITRLDGEGDIYLNLSTTPQNASIPPDEIVAIRAAAGKQVRGRVIIPTYKRNGGFDYSVVRFEFQMPDASEATAKKEFLESRLAHYERRMRANIPGSAWYRQQVRETKLQLGMKIGEEESQNQQNNRRWDNDRELQRTFDLMGGGQAVSENLQLERLLPITKEDPAVVDINTIQGITIDEFDWKPMVKEIKPATDPLAVRIPHDQHAIFFPSFAAMIAVADEADRQGTPLVRAAEPRGERVGVKERYERQLCLPTTTIARLLGPHLVKSVALTGGDPYLRTGSDVAVLFEANNVVALKTLIDARVIAAGSADGEAKPVRGRIDGIEYRGMVSPNREICSYVATLGDTVVVTNSLAQLKQLASVAKKRTPSLASLDEYRFFRERYKRGDAEEQALLILSDATIRRWCGPKWRIAASRRMRAAAIVAEAQAENMDALVAGRVDPASIVTYRHLVDAGRLSLTRGGVASSRYGTLGFQTPIMELDLNKVTKAEADFYSRWRNGYESNWSNFFDPIAARVYLSKEKLAVDLTVMPLIDASDYNEMITLSKGAELKPISGDPHNGALAHWVMALNRQSPLIKEWVGFASASTPGVKLDPLSWVGDSVAVYADEDPFWEELAKTKNEDRFFERNIHRLPVVLEVEVRNVFRLTAFLASARLFIEQASPGLTVWETKEHRGQSYVRVAPSVEGQRNLGEMGLDQIAIYYAPSAGALTLTLNERLLKQAIDRRIERREAAEKAAQAKENVPGDAEKVKIAATPWIGKNVALHVDRRVVELFGKLAGDSYQREMQRVAWANLPILNEWHGRYPGQDPVVLHERIWKRRLVCPGGGAYQWNEKWQTMESTVYGHPGEPKTGPGLPEAIRTISAADFGLTFEEHGLRGRATLMTKPAKQP